MSRVGTLRTWTVGLAAVAWALSCKPATPSGPAPAVAADPRVPRPTTVGDYRDSGDYPYWKAALAPGRRSRWTPEQVVQLLEEYPDRLLEMGIWNARPPGHRDHREVGRMVEEVQRIAARRGTDTSRLTFSFRLDVFAKYRTAGCEDACGWGGTMATPPFDPAFILRVPRSEHRWSMEQRWGGDVRRDPFGPEGQDQWPGWIDRDAIVALNTPERVVALYGGVKNVGPAARRDWQFWVSGVVMDLRNPRYRSWSVARILASLRTMGIDPGEGATLLISYKPGWHAYYGGGPAPKQQCFVPGAHAWDGPAGPCPGAGKYRPGPFHRPSYGPGEFEAGLNAHLRELRAGLVAAGYERVRIMTGERPSYGGRPWTLLAPDVRSAPWLIGEKGKSCSRSRIQAPPDPKRCG